MEHKLFNASLVFVVFERHNSIETSTYQPFLFKICNMLIQTKLSMLLLTQTRLWFRHSRFSFFHPFLYSSKLQ